MKKTPSWQPRFDEKLEQSRKAKQEYLYRANGYRYYEILDEDSEFFRWQTTMDISGNTWSMKHYKVPVPFRRWLKPKQATLLVLKGAKVDDLSDSVKFS